MADVTLRFIPPDEPDMAALRVYEGVSSGGSFSQIERTTAIGGYPQYITKYTTTMASDNSHWFTIAWEDESGTVGAQSTPVQGGTSPNEIMASVGDINANLPADYDSPVVIADGVNTALLQISVARVIRGYLSRVIDNGTLLSWTTPAETPEIIREVAGKLIASQLYINEIAKKTSTIPSGSVAQNLYDQAIAILQQIIIGDILIDGVTADATGDMTTADFFPIDDTDRAFTLGMNM